VEVVLAYSLGLLHGMRHALEPDHVAAVSTVVAEQRSARASVRFALAWGAGHGMTLLFVGGMLFWFRKQMPADMGDVLELAVAVMLVGLGVRALVLAGGAMRGAASPWHHDHDLFDSHFHETSGVERNGWIRVRRPLAIGLMHGLAGSGALAAMVMARLPSAGAGLAFMAVYGAGAMCGMAALAGIAGVPLARLLRLPNAPSLLMAAAGVFSVAFGLVLAWPLVGRLFAL
jgi:hypothetical protein